MHSVVADSFSGTTHWDTFWSQLKVLDGLLMVKYRRDRLLSRCCTDDSCDKKVVESLKQVAFVHTALEHRRCFSASASHRVWARFGESGNSEDSERMFKMASLAMTKHTLTMQGTASNHLQSPLS